MPADPRPSEAARQEANRAACALIDQAAIGNYGEWPDISDLVDTVLDTAYAVDFTPERIAAVLEKHRATVKHPSGGVSCRCGMLCEGGTLGPSHAAHVAEMIATGGNDADD